MSEAEQTEKPIETDDWAQAMEEQASTSSEPVTTPESNHQSIASDALTASTPVFEEFSKDNVLNNAKNDIDIILDIPVQLTVELGRTRIAIRNLLQLAQGSIVELDGMAGEPMDVLVNGCLIAQGEIVVVNEKFGIRLTDIITPSERIRKLNR